MDLIQRAARAGALALEFAVFLRAALLVVVAVALPRLLIVVASPQLPIVIAAPRSTLIAALLCFPIVAASPWLPIIVASPRLALIAAGPRAARPLVVVLVVVVGEQRRLVVIIFVVRLDDIVEPFADRHAGSPRRRAHGFARSGRRPLRFHGPPDFILTPKATWQEQDVPSEPSSLRDDAAGAVLFPR